MSYDELIALSFGSFIMYGLGALPAGWLSDRWSARAMMAIMFIGMGASAVFTGFTSGPVALFIGLGLIGLFGSIYHPVGIALVVRYAVNRGKALGINGIFGGLGMASAAGIAGLLTELVHWRAAFFVPGVFSILIGLAFLWQVPRIRPADGHDRKSPDAAGDIRRLLPILILLIGASVCTGVVYQATSVAMPKFLALRIDGLSSSLIGVGAIVTVIYTMGAFGQYFGGSMADRFDLKRLYICGFAFQVPFLLLMGLVGGLPLLPIVLLGVLISLGIQPISDSLLAHFVPPKWHARAYGARFVASLGVSAAAVPIIAVIYKFSGEFFWLFMLLAGLALLATTTALFVPRPRPYSIVEKAEPSGPFLDQGGVDNMREQGAD